MKCFASDLVKFAAAQVGYKEKASNEDLYDNTANAGNKNFTKFSDTINKKYPGFYNGKKVGSPWCDIFVDYCFLECFGYDNALRLLCQPEKSLGAACRYSLKYYHRAGRFDKIPAIGAQIFFLDKNGVSHHTGIVENYDANHIYTIEGNQGNEVTRMTYARNYARIGGYGHPDYDPEEMQDGDDIKVDESRVLNLNLDPEKYDSVKITIQKG